MIGILILCWISTQETLSQTLSWTVATPVPIFGQDLKLTCTVSSNCCSNSGRIWTKDGTEILNQGKSSDSNKYVEEWDGGTTGFSLIIKSLNLEDDVNKEYDCQYSLFNDTHTLTQNRSWEYHPTESCTAAVYNREKLAWTLDISRTAPLPSVFASFGDRNITSNLIITGPTNFEIWFYSLKVFIDVAVDCHENQKFSLGVVTGTSTTMVCKDENLCYPCWKCGLWYYGISIAAFPLGLALLWVIYLICFRCCDSDSWQIRRYFCFKDETVIDGNKYILYGKGYGKKTGRRAILRAVVLTFIGHIVFFSLFFPLLTVGTYCPACKGLTEIAAIVFGLGGSIFIINFYVALRISREETNSCLQWLYCILIMVLVNLILPIPFLIFYYYLKDGDTFRSCKKALFFIGCVLLAILIFTIPIMIIYNHSKKFFKYVKANIGSNVELPSPYKDANGQVTWTKINGKKKIRYSKEAEIEQSLPQELGSRLHVKGRDLCISDVKESDEGIYECCFTLRDGEAADQKVSKLKLIINYGEEKISTLL